MGRKNNINMKTWKRKGRTGRLNKKGRKGLENILDDQHVCNINHFITFAKGNNPFPSHLFSELGKCDRTSFINLFISINDKKYPLWNQDATKPK